MDRAEPKLIHVKVGWAAVGDYWAVFGETQEEAIERFKKAEELHDLIANRKEPANLEGIPP